MIKKILFLLALAGIAFSGFVAFLINKMINRPSLAAEKQLADQDYEKFSATNENGHLIQGYFYRGDPENGTVILCHGHGVAHGHMDDMVAFLRKAGLNIILFDFRAHGKSQGRLCTIGYNEWKDIKCILEKAKEKGLISKNAKIAAYGRSMGAASLINGSAELYDIDAFILESSFERLRKIAARDAWHNLKIPDTPVTDLAFWIIDHLTSIPYSQNNPVEKIAGIATRPAMLIHDGLDHRANFESFAALKAELPSAEEMIASEARHVQAHKVLNDEFEARLLDFLERAGVLKN
ncbi:MAG: alpha/beta hydrolase [Candidatus Rifleibacteriota bacterium]